MNIQRSDTPPDTLKRHKITYDEYLKYWSEYLHRVCEKTELLDGVIHEIPADGPLTIEWNNSLADWLYASLPASVRVTVDKTLRLSAAWAPTPDFYLYPDGTPIADLQPRDIPLIIEVSNTTLTYDLGGKADTYARHGIREYWVIDPNSKILYAHQLGEDGAYGEPAEIGFTDTITAKHIPGLTLRMADLPRMP